MERQTQVTYEEVIRCEYRSLISDQCSKHCCCLTLVYSSPLPAPAPASFCLRTDPQSHFATPWQARINTLCLLRSSPQLTAHGSWWVHTQLLPGGWGRRTLSSRFLECPEGIQLQMPACVAAFLSLSQSSFPHQFPGITYSIKELHLRPCLCVCLWGNPI